MSSKRCRESFFNINVFVSGFTTRGLCADVIRLVHAEHELIIGDVVLKEVERVLCPTPNLYD